MATGHNSFSVVAEPSSSVPCKIAATGSPIRNYQTHPTVRSLSKVLDNETKGYYQTIHNQAIYYQTWLHVAECKRHRNKEHVPHHQTHMRGYPKTVVASRVGRGGKRTLSIYVEFKQSWRREAHIPCCTMKAKSGTALFRLRIWKKDESGEGCEEGQVPSVRGEDQRSSLKTKWSHIRKIVSKVTLSRGR
jgi:hypothetical protein